MRVVLCGYYGFGNAGDEALLSVLLAALPSSVTPIVLSQNPGQTTAVHQVEAVPRQSLGVLWQTLTSAQGFIWGGGSLLQDRTSWQSPLYYLGLMAWAQRLGLRTVAWAQGIGPLRYPSNRFLTRYLLHRCDAVSVRDPGSSQLLQAWGIAHTCAPDPVWLMSPEPEPPLLPYPAPYVGVNLRPAADLTPPRLAALIAALAQFQAATQATLVLLPFQPSQDLCLAQQLQAQLPGKTVILQAEHPRQWLGYLPQMSMVIAMRLHALIMAAAVGCRCHALSYDPKVKALMQMAHLPGWSLEALPSTAAAIAAGWLSLYGQPGPPSPGVIAQLQQQAQAHRDCLEALIR